MIRYAKGFLTLQVKFAEKIAEVSNQALKDVMIDYTMLRNLFNLRVSHEIPNPLWDAFIEGLGTSDVPEDWIYDFYLQRMDAKPTAQTIGNSLGVSPTSTRGATRRKLRLHFENRETSEYGDLKQRKNDRPRVRSMSAMFRHIQANHPDVETVRGGSWLYNIPAYLRLFPPDYVKTAKPVGYETDVLGIMGTIYCPQRIHPTTHFHAIFGVSQQTKNG